MKRIIVVMCVALLLCGCGHKVTGTKTVTSNPTAEVEILFVDSDGYTVKRFFDQGRYHYYVTPGPAKTVNLVPSGKTSDSQTVQTLGK
jgi:hypothetical protein